MATCYRFTIRIMLLVQLLLAAVAVQGQDTIRARHDSTISTKIEAGDEADVMTPKRELIRWNHFEGKIFSLRIGGGYLEDGATFIQDENSKEQFKLNSDTKLRDFRFVFKGRFGRKASKHPVTYSMGIMYDAPNKKWLFRETGLMFGLPEIWGSVFVGRTKEGFSLNKVMVGYAGWTMERSPMNDATVPILGDGIKWLGYLPKPRILWNLGYFFDKFNEDQSFSTHDYNWVARIMWLPILSEPKRAVLHMGVNLRYGKVDGDTLQLKSRPEAWTAPFFIDTRKFNATNTLLYGGEVYYRKGPWLVGSEYWFARVDAPTKGNPLFHGGEVVGTWLITGETREYNTAGGFFKGISPDRPLFQGGFGAVEAVVHISYIDMDDAQIQGGKFWRITPMINFHLTDNVRLEVAYGYGKLDRFGLIGTTQFFQGRIQLQL